MQRLLAAIAVTLFALAPAARWHCALTCVQDEAMPMAGMCHASHSRPAAAVAAGHVCGNHVMTEVVMTGAVERTSPASPIAALAASCAASVSSDSAGLVVDLASFRPLCPLTCRSSIPLRI